MRKQKRFMKLLRKMLNRKKQGSESFLSEKKWSRKGRQNWMLRRRKKLSRGRKKRERRKNTGKR